MIGDDDPAAINPAAVVNLRIDTGQEAMMPEDFEVRRVFGDLIEGGVAAKGRFLFGQEMDGREIRM